MASTPQAARSSFRKTSANERFELLQEVGSGGIGTVYRASDRELNRIVAVKIIRLELVSEPQYLSDLKRELVLASRVTHEHVVRVYDIGEIDGRALIAMDWIEGENLAQLLRRVHRLPPSQVSTFAVQICEALRAIHAAGIIHQDLKPGNLLIRFDGAILVTDFGLARSTIPEDSRISRPGDIVGTRGYMAPEQLAGLPTDYRSDLYSLGMVLLEMLTGTLALEALAPLRLEWLALDEDRRRGWSELRYLSALDLVIRGCVQPDRMVRHSNCDEILKLLKLAEAESRAAAAPRTSTDNLPIARSGKWRVVVLVAVLLGMILGYATYASRRALRAAQSRTLYNQALDLVTDQSDVGELKRALDMLDQVNGDIPSNVRAARLRLDTLLRLYEQTHETQWLVKARHGFEKSSALGLGPSECTLFRARLDLLDGSFQNVVRGLQGDAALLASSEEANRLLGRALSALHETEAALESYHAAIRINPESWRAHNDLAAALHTLGKLRDARKEFGLVIELRPDFANGYANLGSVLLESGDFLAARKSFEAALVRAPTPMAYYNLGVTAFFLREYASSIPFFEKALQIRPNSDVYVGALADSFRKLHRTENARENYARALALLDDLSASRRLTVDEQCRRARYLARLGDRIAAASALQELTADMNSNEVTYTWAIVAMLEGNFAAANRHLKDAVRLGYPSMLIEMSPDFDDLSP